MQASFTLSPCVKIRQQDCTRDENLTPICKTLEPDIHNLATLRILSCFFSRKQDQNAKLRAFSHLEYTRKSTVLM